MLSASEISIALELPDALISSITTNVNVWLAPIYTPYAQAVKPYTTSAEQVLDAYLPPSPLSAKLPMMTVAPVLFTLLAYAFLLIVLFLFSRVVVSRYTLISVVHNTFMVLLSAYMAVGIATTAHACGIIGWNNAVGSSACDKRLAKLLWLFYFSKVLEFMDTFLMLLKGNYRQVSFLHVYHHTSVFLIWFLTIRWGPGGETYWSSTANSAVHVVMYGYYLMMALFSQGRVRNFLQRRKFIITHVQMLQFVVNIAQSVYDLYIVPRQALRYPEALLRVLLWYMVSLLILFYNFLSNDAARSKKGKAAPAVVTGGNKASPIQGKASPPMTKPVSKGAAAAAATTKLPVPPVAVPSKKMPSPASNQLKPSIQEKGSKVGKKK